MSDMSINVDNIDIGQIEADLTAYYSTPEGQQSLIDMGITDSPYLKPKSKTTTTVLDETPWGSGPSDTIPGGKSQDARMSIKAILSRYKLDSLFDTVWGNYTSDTVDFTDADALALSIRETEAYKKRFVGNEARRAKGLGDLSPATYIALEDSFKQTMKSNGIPDDFYDKPEDFAQLIAGDVSVAEFNDRISYARSVVNDAPASVRNQMAELFNVTEGQLIAYFIDPKKAEPILKEQERAARIGAAALTNAGMQLSADTAVDLAKRGYTEAEAMKAFGNVNKLGELNQAFAGEAQISQQDIIASQFGFNTDAEKQLQKRKAQRLGEFAGGGSYAMTTGETSGSIKSGVGKAQ